MSAAAAIFDGKGLPVPHESLAPLLTYGGNGVRDPHPEIIATFPAAQQPLLLVGFSSSVVWVTTRFELSTDASWTRAKWSVMLMMMMRIQVEN